MGVGAAGGHIANEKLITHVMHMVHVQLVVLEGHIAYTEPMALSEHKELELLEAGSFDVTRQMPGSNGSCYNTGELLDVTKCKRRCQ